MKSLMGSKTAENIIEEFRKKTYCHQLYSNYESIAMEQQYMEISDMFKKMAKNCNEHARIIARFLLCNGYTSDQICALSQTPVFCSDTITNLKISGREESTNVTTIYPEYIKTAYDEDYLEVAVMLYNMLTVSDYYGKKCKNKASMIKNNMYMQRCELQKWQCSRCGYIFTGYTAPEKCPLCAKSKHYFTICHCD